MVFIIKATLKDETRRLSFDGSKFPHYSDVQAKVSGHVALSVRATYLV